MTDDRRHKQQVGEFLTDGRLEHLGNLHPITSELAKALPQLARVSEPPP